MINLNDTSVGYIDGIPRRDWWVYWVLGNYCNYKCSYCVPSLNSGSNKYHDVNVVLDTLKKLPPCMVRFSGGEPTLHPDFERIILEKPEHIRISILPGI